MKKPIADRAEVSLDFPEKFYHGSFDRDATFDVSADEHGVHLDLDRRVGERRHVGFHMHFYLLAGVLDALSQSLAKKDVMDVSQRDALQRSLDKLAKSVKNAKVRHEAGTNKKK